MRVICSSSWRIFLIVILLCVFESEQQSVEKKHGLITKQKPSRLSSLVLLNSPPQQYFDLNVDCVAAADLGVSNKKCGCSEYVCLMNYKFNRLRSIQNCHEICCKRRAVKSVSAIRAVSD